MARRKLLRSEHPSPKESGQKWFELRDRLRSDAAFRGLSFLHRALIERVFERWGHGPRFGNDGFCWFKVDAAAAEFGVDKKTLLRAFAAAESAGVVTISRWVWSDSRKQAPNSYQLDGRFLEPGPFQSRAESLRGTLGTSTVTIQPLKTPTVRRTTFSSPGTKPISEGVEFDVGVDLLPSNHRQSSSEVELHTNATPSPLEGPGVWKPTGVRTRFGEFPWLKKLHEDELDALDAMRPKVLEAQLAFQEGLGVQGRRDWAAKREAACRRDFAISIERAEQDAECEL